MKHPLLALAAFAGGLAVGQCAFRRKEAARPVTAPEPDMPDAGAPVKDEERDEAQKNGLVAPTPSGPAVSTPPLESN